MAIHISRPVVDLLRERGVLPEHCRNITLTVPANGAMVITFEIFVATEHLDILAEAFAAEAARSREQP